MDPFRKITYEFASHDCRLRAEIILVSSVHDSNLQNSGPVFLHTVRTACLLLYEICLRLCRYNWNQYFHCRVVIWKTNGHSATNIMLHFHHSMVSGIYELCVYGGLDDSLQGGTKSQSNDNESVS